MKRCLSLSSSAAPGLTSVSRAFCIAESCSRRNGQPRSATPRTCCIPRCRTSCDSSRRVRGGSARLLDNRHGFFCREARLRCPAGGGSVAGRTQVRRPAPPPESHSRPPCRPCVVCGQVASSIGIRTFGRSMSGLRRLLMAILALRCLSRFRSARRLTPAPPSPRVQQL